jgi:phage replication O-like protein O
MSGEDIQVEDGGYTRIHNKILEQLAKSNLAPLELRILLYLFRKTYGYHKKSDVISISQFEECEGSRVGTIEAIKNLLRLKVIYREPHGQAFEYGFNKYFEEWLPEVFETRYSGRGNNFHKTTSKPVDTSNDDTASKPIDTETSKPVDATSKPVDAKLVNPMIPTKERKKLTKEKLKKAALKIRDPNLDHPGVVLYRGICHLTPNEIQRKAIAEDVTDMDAWKEVLTDWMLHKWKPGNIPGQLDRYQELCNKTKHEPSVPITIMVPMVGQVQART